MKAYVFKEGDSWTVKIRYVTKDEALDIARESGFDIFLDNGDDGMEYIEADGLGGYL